MSHKFEGGCAHIRTHSDHDPIDNHICHCSVCKSVTGESSTHVVFFNHDDLVVENLDLVKRQPFNVNNPDGPLVLATCGECGAPIMLGDKLGRIRAIVPSYDDSFPAATYHAHYDPAAGAPKPDGDLPVREA